MMRDGTTKIQDPELEKVEVVHLGLSQLSAEGVQVFTMVNSDRLTAKLLALFPNQTKPEYWDTKLGDAAGKQETVRHVSRDSRFI